MEKTLETIKCNLEKEIERCSSFPVAERSVHYGESLIQYWLLVTEAQEKAKHKAICPLTHEEIQEWNCNMVNTDGSNGPHWTIEETTALAYSLGVEFTHISQEEWNVTCNMIYSDYYKDAVSFNTDTPSWYGSLAKSWLFDPDALPPKKKLACFFRHVVKPSWE